MVLCQTCGVNSRDGWCEGCQVQISDQFSFGEALSILWTKVKQGCGWLLWIFLVVAIICCLVVYNTQSSSKPDLQRTDEAVELHRTKEWIRMDLLRHTKIQWKEFDESYTIINTSNLATDPFKMEKEESSEYVRLTVQQAIDSLNESGLGFLILKGRHDPNEDLVIDNIQLLRSFNVMVHLLPKSRLVLSGDISLYQLPFIFFLGKPTLLQRNLINWVIDIDKKQVFSRSPTFADLTKTIRLAEFTLGRYEAVRRYSLEGNISVYLEIEPSSWESEPIRIRGHSLLRSVKKEVSVMDLKIKTSDLALFSCHSVILAGCSHAFKVMVNTSANNGSDGVREVYIPQLSRESGKYFIEFVYGNDVNLGDLPKQVLIDLLTTSVLFKFDLLMIEINKFLIASNLDLYDSSELHFLYNLVSDNVNLTALHIKIRDRLVFLSLRKPSDYISFLTKKT